MPLRALLFDMDGTLIDSDPLHAEVFVAFLAERGLAITEADYHARFHGRRNEDIFAEILPEEDPWALHEEKEARFRARLGDRAEPLAGVRAVLARAEAEGWRTAVVTNACRENLEAVLAATGLAARFHARALAEECTRGKPDPEVYARAMEALGVLPEHAIAFEDSPSGLAAARGAGAFTVGVATTLAPEALLARGAQATIRDFADPALEAVLQRFATP